MTKVLRLSLLGRLELQLGDAPLANLDAGKAQALLCYLAVTGKSHSRQALAALLWGDMPESDARRNLRGVVMKLRQAVASHLEVTHQSLGFALAAPHELDTAVFWANCVADATPAQLETAVSLYRGEFLEDFYIRQAPLFDNWLAQQRAEIDAALIDVYDRLIAHALANGRYQTGITYAHKLLQMDSVREDIQRQLMRLLTLSGQRNAALAQFESLRALLADELAIAPAQKTVQLYEQIRQGTLTAAVAPADKTVNITTRRQTAPTTPDVDTIFVAGPPITQPDRFFGRERQVKRLLHLLRRPPLQNAAIIGPRRSGKTSLLHFLPAVTTAVSPTNTPVQAAAPADFARHRWVFVDFQDPRLGRAENLLRYLLEQLALPVPDALNMDSFMDRMINGLAQPAVILLDEIGVALARYRAELDDPFWESLRSLATNYVSGQLGFVLASADAPDSLARHSGLGSPFFNIFGYTAVLGPLTESEALALIHSTPVPFAARDVEWMLAESGRWPILLQILCRERLLTLAEGETGDGWRAEARQQLAPFKQNLLQDTP